MKQKLWAVEWKATSGQWIALDAETDRSSAWLLQRKRRADWPNDKFRVVPYVRETDQEMGV